MSYFPLRWTKWLPIMESTMQITFLTHNLLKIVQQLVNFIFVVKLSSDFSLRLKYLQVTCISYKTKLVNFPFICSTVPAAPAYGVYISQIIRYSKPCSSNQDILDR